MKNLVNAIFGFLGAVFSYSFGMWSQPLQFLLLVVVIDYITGVIASIKEGKGLDSEIGFWGITQKGLMLLIIVLAHRTDVLLQINSVMTGTIYFYVTNEIISLTENMGRMGLPLPRSIKQIIAVLQDKDNGPKSTKKQDPKQ